ncbi:MAG TPA: hypothetical protein VHF06_21970 [Pseudonocardiaceae bacterium]|nr:hypothetical protein [Pseudonocardiaceae bacterium]
MLASSALVLTACGRASDTGGGSGGAGALPAGPAKGTITMRAQGTEADALPRC